MVKNILILGNGFDLAMGRKTSYGDFLRFLNSLSFLLYCQKAYNQQIDVKNYDFLLKEFDDILGDSESDSEEDFQNELEFYNSSSDTVKSDKVKLGILLDCLSNYFNDKKIRLIPFFEKIEILKKVPNANLSSSTLLTFFSQPKSNKKSKKSRKIFLLLLIY